MDDEAPDTSRADDALARFEARRTYEEWLERQRSAGGKNLKKP